MTLIVTHALTLTATATPLPTNGTAPLDYMVLVRNSGSNALTLALVGSNDDPITLPSGAALTLPVNRPESIALASADGTTADVAYFA